MSQAPKRKWDIDIGPEELPKDDTAQIVKAELEKDLLKRTGKRPGVFDRLEIEKRIRRMGIK